MNETFERDFLLAASVTRTCSQRGGANCSKAGINDAAVQHRHNAASVRMSGTNSKEYHSFLRCGPPGFRVIDVSRTGLVRIGRIQTDFVNTSEDTGIRHHDTLSSPNSNKSAGAFAFLT
eukprot:3557408-Rhodomonas_salina.1